MNYIYAELDDNNVCIAVSMLAGEVVADNMIHLDAYDTDLLSKKYENGEWSKENFYLEPSFEEKRAEYLRLIRDAETLGEMDKVDRLRQEWLEVKQQFED
ncbi:hypothetical protein SAMN05446037_104911 [Anaerovirgula multivorans]|uniref:Uncharacterized protein n=1 Tax=Anaerovirgula multivorans TaxID=312168 RepID=A0A239KLI4_9FIRM|nr:hypothetical protein [Anaerovirgula multivorans]SNT18548.1 hypothetical protein SAMN05446037_104911 [Anaerovirgula multivorans]